MPTALIRTLLEDRKAQDIIQIDVREQTSFFDEIIVASATSNRQLSAMADYLKENLKAKGHDVVIDGDKNTDWIVVDVEGYMVHLFKPEARQFYNIERMWTPIADFV